eukprot:IDg10464t1
MRPHCDGLPFERKVNRSLLPQPQTVSVSSFTDENYSRNESPTNSCSYVFLEARTSLRNTTETASDPPLSVTDKAPQTHSMDSTL